MAISTKKNQHNYCEKPKGGKPGGRKPGGGIVLLKMGRLEVLLFNIPLGPKLEIPTVLDVACWLIASGCWLFRGMKPLLADDSVGGLVFE